MKQPYSWNDIVGEGTSVRVTQTQADTHRQGPQHVEYEVTVTTEEASDTIQLLASKEHGDGMSVNAASEQGDCTTLVTVPPEKRYGRLYVVVRNDRYPLFLPGHRLLSQCAASLDGDCDAAAEVLSSFASPPQTVAICGSFLPLEDIGDFVSALANASYHAESYLHAYRYPLLRSAVVDQAGLSVNSARQLEALMEQFDAVEHIGPVTLLDVLADAMATVSSTPGDTVSLLEEIGYDPSALEFQDQGLYFACYLAQVATEDGIQASKEEALQRRWQLDGEYRRRKSRAREATYQERGAYWRKLLCAAARESTIEYCETLANALYWSGEVARTDSRLDELLYRGAVEVAEAFELAEIEARGRYGLKLAHGHRLRGQNCYATASRVFTQAENIAAEHEYLPNWEPVYAKATVESAAKRVDDEVDAAVSVLDRALQGLIGKDVPVEKLNYIVHHLTGVKSETQADVAEADGDTDDPVSLLDDARTHYAAIGLDRSRERADEKLAQTKKHRSSGEGSVARNDPGKPAVSKAVREANAAASDNSYEPRLPRGEAKANHVRSEYAQSRVATNPDVDDYLAPPDSDAVGSKDLMTSPEDRSNERHSDADETW